MAKSKVQKPTPLVTLTGNTPTTTTAIIATALKRRHSYLVDVVRRELPTLNRMGATTFELQLLNSKRVEVAVLNRAHYGYLLTQLRGLNKEGDRVREAQIEFAVAFDKMATILEGAKILHRDDAWIAPRLELKAATKHRSDAVQDFINYAIAQGSKGYRSNPERGYILFTKMAQSAVVTIPPDLAKANPRELMSALQLVRLAQAEQVIDVALRDGMRRSLPYKDVYRLAKSRLAAWADLFGVAIEPLAA